MGGQSIPDMAMACHVGAIILFSSISSVFRIVRTESCQETDDVKSSKIKNRQKRQVGFLLSCTTVTSQGALQSFPTVCAVPK